MFMVSARAIAFSYSQATMAFTFGFTFFALFTAIEVISLTEKYFSLIPVAIAIASSEDYSSSRVFRISAS
jgi:hypothetical protein